jgi:hypothetical protein
MSEPSPAPPLGMDYWWDRFWDEEGENLPRESVSVKAACLFAQWFAQQCAEVKAEYFPAAPPLWGTATCTRDDEGKLYWRCVVDMEEGETETDMFQLAAKHFKEGTIVEVYEPIERD